MKNNIKIAVIGGGASGLLASAAAAYNSSRVTLFERNEKLGKKLYITGKGRCNLTNAAEKDEFFKSIIRNPRFLYSAFSKFDNEDIVALVESMGVKTKVERGNRVFPESDKSSDIIFALTKNAEMSGVDIRLNSRVTNVSYENGSFAVSFSTGKEVFDRVIIATGGVTYRSTGSTGDGFVFAEKLGHSVTKVVPSLVPLTTAENWVRDVMGLTLKNVSLSAFNAKTRIFNDMGEMLFTHFGVTGPLVLSLSGIIADKPEGIRLEIDLKPALDEGTLDKRLIRDFEPNQKKCFKNALDALLPRSLISVIISLSGIDPEKCVSDVTRVERERLVSLLKHLTLTVTGALGFDEAVITRGGVSTKEVDPKTMESKSIPGLYFCGEVLDIDGLTGGFNLQIAFSTGFAAGSGAGMS
ncbi:MAG: NAD(P)/FAD-dependent oxidoreductase [Clostridia bacterium]